MKAASSGHQSYPWRESILSISRRRKRKRRRKGREQPRLEELRARSPPSSLERRAARLEETHEAFLALSFDEAVKPYLSPCHAEDEDFDLKSKDFFTLPMNLLSAGRDRNSLLSGCPSAA
ncbi:hypothetical protein SLA2020_381060 [Shorea laevis]|jgi:hypothetical protein